MKTLVGIRPTGRLHIGHYFSVIEPALRKNANVLVAEYHAPDRLVDLESFINQLKEWKLKIVLQRKVFKAELYFELLELAKIGELERMPQYKSSNNKNMHLLTYPVLMAQDVGGYDEVIVGEDQKPHLEYAKVLLKRHNKMYDMDIVIPKAEYSGYKIMSLTDSSKKMSKSEPKGCLFLHNPKVMHAVTDLEGTLNLANIYKRLIGKIWDVKKNAEQKKELEEAVRKLTANDGD